MKNLKKLGTVLSKVEQKNVIGGNVIKHKPEDHEECTEDMCTNLPNPNYVFNGTGSPFVPGVCRDGVCYYEDGSVFL